MRIRRINALQPEPEFIREAAEALRAGGLVILPTETVYGVAADPRTPDGVERLYRAKSRDPRKPLPLLAAEPDDVRRAGAIWSPAADALARAFWPGALTLVLPVGGGTEGFRVPDHAVARAVIRAAGVALRVTSANSSGEPPALTAEAAVTALGPHLDLVLDAGPSPGGVPSTVVSVCGPVRVLREGAIPAARIRAVAEAAS